MRNPVLGTPGVNGLLLVKPVEGPADSETDSASVGLFWVQRINAVGARKRTNKW
jgi:hypothetical protein